MSQISDSLCRPNGNFTVLFDHWDNDGEIKTSLSLEK